MAIIDDYHLKNNSIPVMDSLLMNRLTIKSLLGFPTTIGPVVGDRYDTVNSTGEITSVSGKSVTIKADPGYSIPGDSVISVNSRKPLNVGFYHFEDGYNTELGVLQKTYEKYNNGGNAVVEPPLYGV